jgi:hypothetical protein
MDLLAVMIMFVLAWPLLAIWLISQQARKLPSSKLEQENKLMQPGTTADT